MIKGAKNWRTNDEIVNGQTENDKDGIERSMEPATSSLICRAMGPMYVWW